MNRRTSLVAFAASSIVLAVTLMSASPARLMPAAPAPSNQSVSAYPNPFGSVLYVAVAGAVNKTLVIRVNAVSNGAILLQQSCTYTGPVTLNTGALPAGGYIVSVSSPNGHVLGRREVRKQ